MPPRITTITTASSVWVFDHDAKTYKRTPREPNTAHPYVPYSDDAVAYVAAELPLPGTSGAFIVWHEGGRWVRSFALEVSST